MRKVVGVILIVVWVPAIFVGSAYFSAWVPLGVGPDNPARLAPLFIALIVQFMLLYKLVTWLDRKGQPDLTRCQQCDYDLRGTDSDTCPECGQPIGPKQQQFLEETFHSN